jgi:hypothetical protein
MPQVIVLAAIGTAAYVGYRYLKRSFGADLRMQEAPVPVKAVYLERGADGIYRPGKRVSNDRI